MKLISFLLWFCFAGYHVRHAEDDISDILSDIRLDHEGEDDSRNDQGDQAAIKPEDIPTRNRRSKAYNDRQHQPPSNPSSPVARGEDDIGSLELSETQSQSVDGTKAVTQAEDVANQLEAEKLRLVEKIEAARNRRAKALQDVPSQCTDIVVHDSAGAYDAP